MSPHAIAVTQVVLYSIAALFTVARLVVKRVHAKRTKRAEAALLELGQNLQRLVGLSGELAKLAVSGVSAERVSHTPRFE